MRKIFELFSDLVHVPKCAGCGQRMSKQENGICKACYEVYLDAQEEYCDFCGMAARLCTCVPQNMYINGCIDYKKLIFYKKSEERIRKMLYSLKRGNNISLMKFFAEEMLKIDEGVLPEDVIITYAPRSEYAVIKYGYDHGKILAKNYASQGGYRFEKIIHRRENGKNSQQKLLNYKQRLSNTKGMFFIKNKDLVKGKHILILDDVVTSGATLGECAFILFEAGARSVTCRSIAHTYKNNKSKSD